jgi:capsular polysaccharide biosynthesis protein
MELSSDASPTLVYRDALSMPTIADPLGEGGPPTGVYIEPPALTRSFKREQPEFLADPDDVGLFDGLAPGVFHCPPAFVVRARRARIVGFRTVLSQEGFFFNDDSTGGEPHKEQFLSALSMPDPLNEETGLRRLADAGPFVLDLRGRAVRHLSGTTVVLSSSEPSNYGSWLFRVLPKLETLKRLGLGDEARFLVWVGTPAFRDYLRLLGVPEERIIHHDPKNVIYALDNALVPSVRNNQAFLDAESLALYSRMRDQLGEKQSAGNRIYISRLSQSQQGSPRAMRNEPELIERLKAIGFRIVSPERLSVAEQVRVFSSAEMVVGPSGSGMFNVVFCRPGTKVIDIESEPHWIHAHLCLFASCGLRAGIFVGKAIDGDFTIHHKPWSVNIEDLIRRIDAFSLAS